MRDQLAFNEKAEFGKMDTTLPAFLREEPIAPTGQLFDVDEADIKNIWQGLDAFQEKEKVLEIRIPPLPEMLFGAGVAENMGERIRRLNVKKLFLVTAPVMVEMGRAGAVCKILEAVGLSMLLSPEVAPYPAID